MSETELALLESGAAELGTPVQPAQARCLLAYLDLLYQWNKAAGLTTVSRDDAVRLHLLDSLAALPLVVGDSCLDLGTGAGLPGLVLAIASPGTRFVLVESNRRRCSFLLEARRLLRISNLEVVESDVESLGEDRYPLVISRAFRAPEEFLAIAKRLVMPGGRVVVMLADRTRADIERLEAGSGLQVCDTRCLLLPGGNEPRTILAFQA